MSKTIEIGPYSAYAIAVKYGYVGTEEDWIKAVEAARKSAETSAANAKREADGASTSAATATEQAGIATTKAGESAASAKASASSASAAATSEANAKKYSEEAGAKASTDKTLSIENAPADAAAVGNIILDPDGNAIFYSKAEVEAKIKEILAAQREEDLARIKFWVSDGPTSPASFIGGTWERIEGKFIMGASDTYPAGSTGGSTAHEHEYKLEFMWRFGALVGYPSCAIAAYNYKTQSWNDNNKKVKDGQYTLSNDGFFSTYGEKPGGEIYSVTGNTASSSSIPPYYSVYIWRRVA